MLLSLAWIGFATQPPFQINVYVKKNPGLSGVFINLKRCSSTPLLNRVESIHSPFSVVRIVSWGAKVVRCVLDACLHLPGTVHAVFGRDKSCDTSHMRRNHACSCGNGVPVRAAAGCDSRRQAGNGSSEWCNEGVCFAIEVSTRSGNADCAVSIV